MNNCNLSTCRYNVLGECENEEKRKECIEVSMAVLCLEDNGNENRRNEKLHRENERNLQI